MNPQKPFIPFRLLASIFIIVALILAATLQVLIACPLLPHSLPIWRILNFGLERFRIQTIFYSPPERSEK